MYRLIEKDAQGNWCLRDVPWSALKPGAEVSRKIYEKLYVALWKLMDYEDTGLSPERIHKMDKLYLEKCEEVNELRMQQEQKKQMKAGTDGILLFLNKDGVADVYDDTYDITIHCETKEEQEQVEEMLKNCRRWIPVEEQFPASDDYILLSFENMSTPLIGRYEEDQHGGTFYVGDDEKNCVSYGLFVNAWMPLPEPYGDDTEEQ